MNKNLTVVIGNCPHKKYIPCFAYTNDVLYNLEQLYVVKSNLFFMEPFVEKELSFLDELILGTRILVNENVIDGFGHISVRDPRNAERFWMLRENGLHSQPETLLVELDLGGNPAHTNGPRPSIERFIHSEIYRARPDVNSVVHTHAPALIPFGVTGTPLKPLFHLCGFLEEGAPNFDIEVEYGPTNLLITDESKGKSLAKVLGPSAIVLMRGHGATVVGSSIQEAVYRAVYSTLNAAMQPTAMALGTPKYLSPEEAIKSETLHREVLSRPWNFWKSKLTGLKSF
jgi:ribulose-5-phosphate 4-epimerase/fuculose-1-phosphate aldolase